MDTVLRSRTKTVTIGAEQPFCIIGERINPTGRKAFAQELRAGDLSTGRGRRAGAGGRRRRHARRQRRDPAGRRGRAAGSRCCALVQDTVDAPICIDSSVIEALEAGLSVYEGRALVNSVTAEDDRLEVVLPLVARHDAAVIGLTNDETGIPHTAEERLRHARKIVSAAQDYGIKPEDVVIDPLAMPIGADTETRQDDAAGDADDP